MFIDNVGAYQGHVNGADDKEDKDRHRCAGNQGDGRTQRRCAAFPEVWPGIDGAGDQQPDDHHPGVQGKVTGDMGQLFVQGRAAAAGNQPPRLNDAIEKPTTPDNRGMKTKATQPPTERRRLPLRQRFDGQANGSAQKPGKEHEEEDVGAAE